MLQLLRLNIPPAFEDDLVDFLLASEHVSGFQSMTVRGHGEGGTMNIAEQVAGRRKRIQFDVVLAEAVLLTLLETLSLELPLVDIRYWVFPVIQHGRLADLS